MAHSKYLIVGGGHAGCVAALAVRAGDPSGSITLVGEETRLPYERPALSKAFLAGEIEFGGLRVRDADALAAAAIKLRLSNRVTRIFPGENRVELSDGGRLGYDRLLLATGSRARHLDVPGAALRRVHYLRTAEDSLALRRTLSEARHLVVVGAGYVGLEVAATARRNFGCQVTVVEAGTEVLQRAAPEQLRQAVRGLHEENGVAIRLRTLVDGFEEKDGAVSAVHLSDGDVLTADGVLVCIGAAPNSELAQAAGLVTGDGILTDAHGRTSAEGVFAAGEVARHVIGSPGRLVRFESWQMAQFQAATVGGNMAGGNEPIAYVPWFWTDQYGHNFQMLGRTDPDLPVAVRAYDEALKSTILYFDGPRIVGALCIDSGRDVAPIRKAIAAGLGGHVARLSDTSVKLKSAFIPV